MKKVILLIFVIVAFGAANTFAQSRQTYFPSKDACLSALQAGTANYYRPTYFSLHKAVANGEESRGLESDACVNMLTVKGYQWVAQREGERMVFRGLVITRREDCGNPIREVAYPAAPVAEVPKCPPNTYPSETPGVCIQEKERVTTNTVTVPGPTVTVPGPCVPGQPVTSEEEVNGRKATVTRDGCHESVEYKRKGSNKYMWLAIGAGGMFVACEVGKFCGTRTRTITQIVTSAPKVQESIHPRPTIGADGRVIGTTPIATRPVINGFTGTNNSNRQGNTVVTPQGNTIVY